MKKLHAGRRLPVILSVAFCQIPSFSFAQDVTNADFVAQQRMILNVPKPGYLNIANHPANGAARLLVSSFKMFGEDSLLAISNWHQGVQAPQQLHTEQLTENITWPNEARSVSRELFNEEGILVSGGFLVPGKSTGAITFVPWSNPKNQQELTTPRKGWFYHRTEEWDVNGDGYLDIITARAYKPMIGRHDGELLWLENPGHALQSGKAWKEHLIGRGPDVHFRILPSSPSYPLTIISTEFSAKKMSAYRLNKSGEFDYTVLDDSLGSAFDVQIDDLNRDGQLDLLVTNHEGDLKASVFAYEFDPISLKIHMRHTLLTGIETRQKAIKSASPGPVMTFYPSTTEGLTPHKPWILVSGDGSQKAHILVPRADRDSKDWQYQEHVLWNPTSTVGQSAVADIDGDGRVEIFIPAYDANQVSVFTLEPKL
ncbi:MAG: hypothetical protein FJY29_06460 [Betaproteobacteria bacterium]|nr:hypothetical protein [Betaproteobacteria bacterium]